MQDALERQVLTKFLDPTAFGSQQLSSEHEIAVCLKILDVATNICPETVPKFISALIKILERYAKEYTALLNKSSHTPSSVTQQSTMINSTK